MGNVLTVIQEEMDWFFCTDQKWTGPKSAIQIPVAPELGTEYPVWKFTIHNQGAGDLEIRALNGKQGPDPNGGPNEEFTENLMKVIAAGESFEVTCCIIALTMDTTKTYGVVHGVRFQ